MIQIEAIFSNTNLAKAWKNLRVKNKGGGIDNITIDVFEKNLDKNIEELHDEVCNKLYVPEPYKRIFIEKNEKEYRPLSLLTIKDKLVQLCFIDFFRWRIEKKFVDTSYAYRINKGHNKAINRIQDFVMRSYLWVCPIDIDNYFDSIDRDLLIKKCKLFIDDEYLIKLLEMWIKIGVVYKGKYIDTGKGIAQGGVVSPLLSNIYLNDYDHVMKEKEYNNVRYADNILLVARDKEKLKSALLFTQTYLADELNLKLNKFEKDAVNITCEPFIFCGIQFIEKKRKIDPHKLKKIQKNITNTLSKYILRECVPYINENLDGIKRYYSSFDTEVQIAEIENHIIKELSNKINVGIADKSLASATETRGILAALEFVTQRTISSKKNIIDNLLGSFVGKKSFRELEVKKAIAQKRRKYQKFWYESLDVFISGAYSQIGKSGNNITIRKDGKIRSEVSTDRIKNILVSANAVTISSDAVKLCAEKNIRINYFDRLGKPYASIISTVTPISSLVVKQAEIINTIKSKIIARNIIYAKIKNQAGLIKYFWKNKPPLSESKIADEIQSMIDISEKVKTVDLNIDLIELRPILMGFEGSAAAAYWKLFKMTIPPEYSFEEREHQHAENIVNMMLNYSYGILYTRILSAVTLVGLNPNISFLHTEQQNKPTLVYDMIELFRAPVADRAVIAVLQKGIKVKANKNLLSDSTKNILAQKVLTRLNSEFKYRGKITCYNEIIVEQAKELAAFIKNENKLFKTFLMKW